MSFWGMVLHLCSLAGGGEPVQTSWPLLCWPALHMYSGHYKKNNIWGKYHTPSSVSLLGGRAIFLAGYLPPLMEIFRCVPPAADSTRPPYEIFSFRHIWMHPIVLVLVNFLHVHSLVHGNMHSILCTFSLRVCLLCGHVLAMLQVRGYLSSLSMSGNHPLLVTDVAFVLLTYWAPLVWVEY